jgi:magnesium transporter
MTMDDARKPPVGAKPGTLAIDPRAPQPKIKAISYSEESIEERDLDGVGELRELKARGDKLWVDVQGLGNEGILRELAELFSIHPLALEDIVHIPIRPKSEPYKDNLLIISRMLRHADGDDVDTEQASIVVGRNYVLTFQEDYGDVLDPVRHRLQVPRSMMRRLSSDYLAYAILDTIIDAYYPVIEKLGDRIEKLEELVLREASPETLRDLTAIKSTLLGLRRAVVPQRDAVNALIRDECEFFSDAVRIYLRDTYDHVVQTSEAVETARELVGGLMNTYLSVVSNRMNEVMKTLTIVASIFIPITFLAGIYGMNFEHMPELHLRWGYPALILTMVAVGVGMLIYFKRKGWIGRSD